MKLAVRISCILFAGLFSTAYAEPRERVFIDYTPGSGSMVSGAVRAEGGKVHYEFDRIDAMAVSITPGMADRLIRNPNIRSMQPDAKRYPAAVPSTQADSSLEQVVPYGIERVQAPLVWAEGHTGQGITVCVIDTGLYYDHEDIDGASVIGGYSQDPGSAWFEDGHGHGTHVAGTINAADNDVGVVGVSPGHALLYAVKVFGEDGLWTYASDLIAAAFKCSDEGAHVINMSLSGTGGPISVERKAFDALYSEDGVLLVASASNDGTQHKAFPASYDSVISVAATDEFNVVADFSNQNRWVELAAPGVDVLSTVPYVSDSWLYLGGEPFEAMTMEFSPYGSVAAELVNGGLCDTPVVSGDWTAKVVLCERGDITFADKLATVMAGGGSAAVIFNNEPGLFSGTLGEEGEWIVAISVSQEVGQAALAYLAQEVTVQSSPPIPGSSYEAWNGTSMSAPHVSGVAALLWSANPGWSNAQVREAMDMTALDLGEPGRDDAYGFGLVQAYDALQYEFVKGVKRGPKKP